MIKRKDLRKWENGVKNKKITLFKTHKQRTCICPHGIYTFHANNTDRQIHFISRLYRLGNTSEININIARSRGQLNRKNLVNNHNKTIPPEEEPIELDTIFRAFANKLWTQTFSFSDICIPFSEIRWHQIKKYHIRNSFFAFEMAIVTEKSTFRYKIGVSVSLEDDLKSKNVIKEIFHRIDFYLEIDYHRLDWKHFACLFVCLGALMFVCKLRNHRFQKKKHICQNSYCQLANEDDLRSKSVLK